MNKICIYHANCIDGFAAALAVYAHNPVGSVDFHPASYGESPPDCTGREVMIVDFSYPREQMQEVADQCERLLLLDHHKTALENLAGWEHPKTNVILDMERSGALMAWEYFTANVPEVIRHVSDRDLWQFKLEGTREVHAGLCSLPKVFSVWLPRVHDVNSLIKDGDLLLRQFNRDAESITSAGQTTLCIARRYVPAVNCPPMYASEIGHVLGERALFAATFHFSGERVKVSLRSRPEGEDVSEIARQYGGGGHKHAAGFEVGQEQFYSEMLTGVEPDYSVPSGREVPETLAKERGLK